MKLEEAIEFLEKEDRRSYPKRRLEAHLALKLGVEALKMVKEQRQTAQRIIHRPLPGETEG